MSSTNRSLIQHATVDVSLMFCIAAPAGAQQQTPAPASSEPEFFTRYNFHLTAAALGSNDQRFSWDTHFGGELDLLDYVAGRASVIVDYEAVLGDEFRPFDPNQGNYTLEASSSVRAGKTEIVGFFHHVSRHLSDRPKRFSVAWNTLGARVLRRESIGPSTVDISVEAARVLQHSYVDYVWIGQADLMARLPLTAHFGLFAHGSGQVFSLDPAIAQRERQAGGLVEAGLRLTGRSGAIELFAGYEMRVDADPLDRQPQHWGLAGFRLLSR
jgi:hypothetical protein